MEIILNKKRNKWANFLIITGVLSFWLTIAYFAQPNPMGRGGYLDFKSLYEVSGAHLNMVIYFFTNSVAVILLGVFLKFKRNKIYSTLAIFLFISVIIGWAFPLVQEAVFSGLTFGIVYGGPLIIPMFHVAVVGSFLATLKRLRGKAIYEDSGLVTNEMLATKGQDSALQGLGFQKNKLLIYWAYFTIATLVIFGVPNFVVPLIFRPIGIFNQPYSFITIIGIVSAIITIFTKKQNVYRFAKVAMFIFSIVCFFSTIALLFMNNGVLFD